MRTEVTMPAGEEIGMATPGPSDTNEQYNTVRRSQPQTVSRKSKRRWGVTVGLITMIIFAGGLVMHTICLASPNLVKLQTTMAYDRLYQFKFEEPPISNVDMGFWKMCSKAWHFDCVDWASSSEVNETTGTIVSIKKPDWLIVAQYTGVAGLVVAIITEVMVIIHLYICFRHTGKCRLFPLVICIGAMIAGGLVLISCTYVILNYDSIPNHVAQLEEMANSAHDLMTKTNSSVAWGFYMEMASVLLLWLAAFSSLCNHRGAGKASVDL